MTTMTPFNPLRKRSKQQGSVLIIGLIFMLVLTLLSISMTRTLTMQESIAGNTREKQRSFEAAQSALEYGEWWLSSGGGTPIECVGTNLATAANAMRVCNLPPGSVQTLPWAIRTDYQPPSMTVDLTGGLSANGDINYRAMPGMYINYLGPNAADPKSQVYQISGFGYGGSATAASVVQSTYQMSSGNLRLDQP